MRDDERYPIVVSGPDDANAPEVVTGPQPDLEGCDKIAVETTHDGLIPTFDDTQKEVVANKGAGGDIRGGEASIATASPKRTCCGMKRRTFFIALAVLTAVLVAAIVGGVVGGLHANSSSSDDNNNDSGSSPTETSSGHVPRKTGPIDADERCMAASIVTDDDNQNPQVFYNDLNTTNIHYRRIHDDEGTDDYTLDLDIEPNWGAPMAAAAGLSSSRIETRLYYVITSDNETQIAQAVLSCGSLDADEDEDEDEDDDDDDDGSNGQTGPCSVTSNSIISTNATNGVHPDTKLAALRLSNDSMRVYFQAPGANIWVLHDDDDGQWTGSNLVGNVREGSSIAAAAANATELHVFYVSNTTERLRYVDYSDILGADDVLDIDESPGSGWSPSAAFASIYVPSFESYRLYYTNPSTGTIVSYFQNSTTPWSVNQDDNWGKPDSSITAVSFENQVRLIYFQDSTLVMSSQDATAWTEPEEVGGEA
ncbi:hypothetical protein G7Z17_g12564 [Cylindrodendrum hubeiense]|uniref:Fucose-specific lectin n=1 Tax=Cylindrodendrum hubeiense TaxID=595255 RepID=A0A9P5GYN4_9HYPO|nr:hypothetical protein G7Z17_g12564 [Cylindrodendrum hubeiense]